MNMANKTIDKERKKVYNADRQKRHRERQKAKGLKQYCVYYHQQSYEDGRSAYALQIRGSELKQMSVMAHCSNSFKSGYYSLKLEHDTKVNENARQGR